MNRFIAIRHAVSLLTFVLSAASLAAPPAATAPSAIDAVDWVVLDVSVTQNTANDRDAWPSTLPPFVTSRRTTAGADESNRAWPIGVIHLYGTLDRESPMDVLINLPGGDTQATWPRAQVKSNRILWSNLVPPDENAAPAAIDAPHWISPLRTGNAALFRADRQVDSMLIYDVSLKLAPPLKLTEQAGTLFAKNTGNTPIHNLTFYKSAQAGQWTQASLPTLPGSKTAKPKTTTTQPSAAEAFDGPTTLPSTAPTAHSASATMASTAPATTSPASQPADNGRALVFTPLPANNTSTSLTAWRPVLLDAGVPASDVDTVVDILSARVTADRWMTAVYRLDGEELDRLLPLEIVPAPRQIKRIGLVVVHGIDPAIVNEIDRLIAQCGDSDYAKRKEATDQLIAIGKPAKTKLEKAQNNPDVEIAQRAELILSAIETQKKE